MSYFTTEQITKLDKLTRPQDIALQFSKFGCGTPSLAMAAMNVYSFATMREMSIEQKQDLVNLFLGLIYEIPKLTTTKADFLNTYEATIDGLSQRSAKNLTPKFTLADTFAIKEFCKKEIIPYYELYEFVLDFNPEFTLATEVFDPIPSVKEAPIYEGQVVQPETIDVLK